MCEIKEKNKIELQTH